MAGARMLVVDDDDFTRFLLVRTLHDLGYDSVMDAASVAPALSAAKASIPDGAILDLDLGAGPNGIDCAHALRKLAPSIAIVMLSSYQDPRLMGANRPLPEGSVYLSKRSLGNADMLAATVAEVLESPCARRSTAVDRSVGPKAVKLSDNQIDIMRLVAEGYSNAEIARRTFVTEPGVAKAIGRLVKQLGIETGPDANVRVRITQAYYSMVGFGRTVGD
jgi:DNA-binding NarL/FixJ family response regulator